MELETERLILRPLAMADLDALYPLQRQPKMQRYFGDGHAYTRQESATWLEWHVAMWELDGYSFFAAELRPDRTFVGWVGISRVLDDPELPDATEIGWFIAPEHHGQGLAPEGARATLDFGFGPIGLDRIIARYNSDNTASGRVMEKIGMRRWCERPHNDIPGATVTMYEISASEHAARGETPGP